MTKGEILKILQEDKSPMNTEMEIYLECTNNDTGIWGRITGLSYFNNKLGFDGDYEESEY